MNIYNILSSIPHNPHFLHRYIKFIYSCNLIEQTQYVENHHICPKAKDLFPQYKDLRVNPWNKISLTARQHFIAHKLLWKTYPSSSMAYVFFNFCNNFSTLNQQRPNINIKTSKTYQLVREQNAKNISNKRRGMVNVKNLLTGEKFSITSEEYKKRESHIVSVTSGIKTGSNPQRNAAISKALSGKPKSEEHINKQKLSREKSGRTVMARNCITNNIERITKDEFSSDHYVGSTSGYCNYRDKTGTIIHCSISDPRVLSGELQHMSLNYISAIDAEGIKYFISKDDTRLLSGELTKVISKRKKTILINNGKISKWITPNLLQLYIDQGWVLGKSPITKQKLSSKVWMRNDIISRHVMPDKVQELLNQGYWFGRIISHRRNK